MTTDLSAYFARAKAESPSVFPEPESSTLEAYLTNSLTSQQCAVEITKYINRQVPVNSKVGAVFGLILHAARDLPENHDDLVELLQEIRTIPPSKDNGNLDWRNEMQSFNETVRGINDSLWSDTLGADQTNARQTGQTDTSRQWTNFNALLAKLYANDLCDVLLNGLQLITKTLEEDKISVAQLEMNLGATAAWLEHASKPIKINAAKISTELGWAKENGLLKDNKIDQHRLASWRERLEKLSSTEGLSDETVEACERASYAIEKALWEKAK